MASSGRSSALAFIEFIRNTPQLVQIIFWYVAILQSLPPPRQSIPIPGGFLLNIRGLYVPNLIMQAGDYLNTALVFSGIIMIAILGLVLDACLRGLLLLADPSRRR